MKIPHVEICPVDCFGAAERSRQGVLSLNNVAYRKGRHDGLSFTPGKELAQLFERRAGQRFKRTEMTQKRVYKRICADQQSKVLNAG